MAEIIVLLVGLLLFFCLVSILIAAVLTLLKDSPKTKEDGFERVSKEVYQQMCTVIRQADAVDIARMNGESNSVIEACERSVVSEALKLMQIYRDFWEDKDKVRDTGEV